MFSYFPCGHDFSLAKGTMAPLNTPLISSYGGKVPGSSVPLQPPILAHRQTCHRFIWSACILQFQPYFAPISPFLSLFFSVQAPTESYITAINFQQNFHLQEIAWLSMYALYWPLVIGTEANQLSIHSVQTCPPSWTWPLKVLYANFWR